MKTEVSKSTTSKTSWPIGYFMKCLEVKGRENGLFHRLAPSVSYLLLHMKSYSSFQCPFWPHLVGFRTIYILFVKGLYSYSSCLLSLSMSSYPAFLFLNIENCILFSLEKSHLHNYKSVQIFLEALTMLCDKKSTTVFTFFDLLILTLGNGSKIATQTNKKKKKKETTCKKKKGIYKKMSNDWIQ